MQDEQKMLHGGASYWDTERGGVLIILIKIQYRIVILNLACTKIY
jgi:hypothetical protein